jgi:hypothetical protein
MEVRFNLSFLILDIYRKSQVIASHFYLLNLTYHLTNREEYLRDINNLDKLKEFRRSTNNLRTINIYRKSKMSWSNKTSSNNINNNNHVSNIHKIWGLSEINMGKKLPKNQKNINKAIYYK